jgi:serine/threonine protein kinase
MTEMNDAAARTSRDRDDFGRALKALLASDDSAEAVVTKVLHANLKSTRNKKPLQLSHLTDFMIPPHAVVASGGGGLVLQCIHRVAPSVKYALKIVRPSLLTSEEAGDEQRRAVGEFVKHAPLSHQNIARVYSAGEFTVSDPKDQRVVLQYMVVEWIDDAKPLRKYLASKFVPNWESALSIITQAFAGIEHLHHAGLVHWDVKSENFLVAQGIPKLSDLGSARRRDLSAVEPATALSTRWNVPLALLGAAGLPEVGIMSSRRMPIEVPDRTWDTPWLDLWMLARDLNRLFRADEEVLKYDVIAGNPQLPEFATESNTFLTRCFPGHDADARHAFDLVSVVLRRLLRPKEPGAPRFYDHSGEVIADIRKLDQPLGAAHRIAELHTIPQRVLRIPIWNNIPYTDRLGALFNSPLVKRLNKHLQLGALVQVYPGASHRRSEHSVGVFGSVCEYVRALYADRRDPFWRLNIEAADIDALCWPLSRMISAT